MGREAGILAVMQPAALAYETWRMTVAGQETPEAGTVRAAHQ